jgi:hypothetical protein
MSSRSCRALALTTSELQRFHISYRCGISTSSRSFRALILAVSEPRLLHGRFGLSPMPIRNFDCYFPFHVHLVLSPLPHRNVKFFTFVSVALVFSELRFPQVPLGLSLALAASLPPLNFTYFSESRSYRYGTSTSARSFRALVLAVSEPRLLYGRYGLSPMPLRNFDFLTFLSGSRLYLIGLLTSSRSFRSPWSLRNFDFLTFLMGSRPSCRDFALASSELRLLLDDFGLSSLQLWSLVFLPFLSGSRPYRFGTLMFSLFVRAFARAASRFQRYYRALVLTASELRSPHVFFGFSLWQLGDFNVFTFLPGSRPCFFGTSTYSRPSLRHSLFFTFLSGVSRMNTFLSGSHPDRFGTTSTAFFDVDSSVRRLLSITTRVSYAVDAIRPRMRQVVLTPVALRSEAESRLHLPP